MADSHPRGRGRTAYLSPADQLRAQFHAWERQGRGLEVFPQPVELEPVPAAYRHEVQFPDAVDNGRRLPLILTAGTLGLALLFRRRRARDEPPLTPSRPSVAPATRDVTELQLLLPRDFDRSRGAVHDLTSLSHFTTGPISMELVGSAGVVSVQVACAKSDADVVARHLGRLAPTGSVRERTGFLEDVWEKVTGSAVISDIGLAAGFLQSLRTLSEDSADPLAAVIDALAAAEEGEIVAVQLLWSPTRQDWSAQVRSAIRAISRHPAFRQSTSQITKAATEKIREPLFACRLRLAAKAASQGRAQSLVERAFSALSYAANRPLGNSVIRLGTDGWPPQVQQSDLFYRTAHRHGMILNQGELAAFVHLPGRETAQTALERLTARTKAVPATTTGHHLVLGANVHHGSTQVVSLSPEQRARHLYVIGGSGTGKSTLLLNLITQDLEAGHGLAVLDPHGDLVDAVLGRIPRERVEDVVVIDPADEAHPVSINVLAAHSELEKTLLASDLVAAFRRQATSWGDQMNAVFAHAILATLNSSRGGTLLDLRRFLVEKEFRADYLKSVADEEVLYYWQREFPLLRGNPQAPILTRLDAFLRPRLVRNIVANPGQSLDLRALMDGRKIILAKLAHGAIGEENAHLLGALILAKLQQLALSRQDVEESARAPFHVVVDEFHHFATPTTATLLSGVRKFAVNLTLAGQSLSQVSSELVDSVLTNAGTRICFRLGDADARKLSDGFSFFDARDLQNLDTGQAIVRVGRADNDFNLTTYPADVVDPAAARARADEVIEASRRQFARPLPEPPVPPRAVAGAALSGPMTPAPEPTSRQQKKPRARPVSAGRGGQQHQYLQALIQRLGQDRGFKATIEQSVLDGIGAVDVALERDGLRIACEVWLTTPLDNEVKNAQKCLAAGFDQVVMVGQDARALKRLSKAVDEAVTGSDRARVHLVAAENLPTLLDTFVSAAPKVETIGGYEVKVRFSPGEQTRRNVVQDVIVRSMKRLRGK